MLRSGIPPQEFRLHLGEIIKAQPSQKMVEALLVCAAELVSDYLESAQGTFWNTVKAKLAVAASDGDALRFLKRADFSSLESISQHLDECVSEMRAARHRRQLLAVLDQPDSVKDGDKFGSYTIDSGPFPVWKITAEGEKVASTRYTEVREEVDSTYREAFDLHLGFSSRTFAARRLADEQNILVRFGRDVGIAVHELTGTTHDRLPGPGWVISGIRTDSRIRTQALLPLFYL